VLLEASCEEGILDRSSQADSIGAASESNCSRVSVCVEATLKSLWLSLHSTPEQFMNQSADISLARVLSRCPLRSLSVVVCCRSDQWIHIVMFTRPRGMSNDLHFSSSPW
jgi:hypothetical protein